VGRGLTIYYAKSLTIAIVFKVLESYATDLAITAVFRKIAISNASRGINLIFITHTPYQKVHFLIQRYHHHHQLSVGSNDDCSCLSWISNPPSAC